MYQLYTHFVLFFVFVFSVAEAHKMSFTNVNQAKDQVSGHVAKVAGLRQRQTVIPNHADPMVHARLRLLQHLPALVCFIEMYVKNVLFFIYYVILLVLQ